MLLQSIGQLEKLMQTDKGERKKGNKRCSFFYQPKAHHISNEMDVEENKWHACGNWKRLL